MEDMAQKGLLFRRRKGEALQYSAIPFIHGLLEFQVPRTDKDLKKTVKLAGSYINEVLKHSMARNAELFVRTIPVQRSVRVVHHVAAYEDACEILRKEKLIVITDCACRKQKALFGKDCGKPMEVCFMFGPMGQYYIDNGFGRRIDLDEALAIQNKAHDAGLITQPAAAQEPYSLCNCCVDCCGFLRAVSKQPKPADFVFSNHTAVVDPKRCSGCGTCLERCGMKAVTVNLDGHSEIDLDRCIGCGLCVTTCTEEALHLAPKPEEALRKPPTRTAEQMVQMARKRGIKKIDATRIVSYGF